MLCSTIGGAFSYTLCFTPYQLCIVVKLTRASAQFFVQLLIKTLLSFFFCDRRYENTPVMQQI